MADTRPVYMCIWPGDDLRERATLFKQMKISKKQRRRIRSSNFKHMKPHVFDKLIDIMPHTLYNFDMPSIIIRHLNRGKK